MHRPPPQPRPLRPSLSIPTLVHSHTSFTSSPLPMANPPPAAVLYAGSCNPPRRAKRVRTNSFVESDPEDEDQLLSPQSYLPSPDSRTPATSNAPPGDGADTSPTRRRGRKPGTVPRSVRESLRRTNHSRIEKARRCKINDALAALRELVPKQTGSRELEDDDTQNLEGKGGKTKGKKEKEEKEFKLEVLVRTVAYLRELTEKVNAYESGGCPRCAGAGTGLEGGLEEKKRKRVEQPDVEEGDASVFSDDDIDMADDQDHDQDDSLSASSHPTLPASRPSLPSISSWLPSPPYPHLNSNSHPTYPNQYPYSPIDRKSTSPVFSPSLQLPSPPTSTRTQPIYVGAVPPALTLPPPGLGISQSKSKTQSQSQSRHTSLSNSPTRSHPVSTLALPHAHAKADSCNGRKEMDNARGVKESSSPIFQPVSPVWTREDESAASLLLQISSSSSSSSSSSGSPLQTHLHPPVKNDKVSVREAQTPGSLLGLNVHVAAVGTGSA